MSAPEPDHPDNGHFAGGETPYWVSAGGARVHIQDDGAREEDPITGGRKKVGKKYGEFIAPHDGWSGRFQVAISCQLYVV